MQAIRLIQTQLRLECIGLHPQGTLVRTPGPDPDDIARAYAFRHASGYVHYCRHDLPDSTREQIAALGAERAYHDREAVKTLLAQDAVCAEVGEWQTYVFLDILHACQFPDTVRLTEAHRALIDACDAGMNVTDKAAFAIIRDGVIVSASVSARENDQAGECYVFTVPEYRGRGYARQVIGAWAAFLRAGGRIPFYSHAQDNPASRSVARGLRLRPVFSSVTYD